MDGRTTALASRRATGTSIREVRVTNTGKRQAAAGQRHPGVGDRRLVCCFSPINENLNRPSHSSLNVPFTYRAPVVMVNPTVCGAGQR